VDVEVERLMQEMITSVFTDCTVIAIAHRLETIMDFDRIAVMDNGRLVECDTPAALLARDSAFRKLYAANRSQG
jgi:ATP-binding cassette subfamily C (CFTR/MRP) protein 1